ncbi:MAG: hypothetical protein UH543_08025, partial [Bacteroidales bacterium]|nr:hypothetical protein [Bacteroidales bacterium]
NFFVVIAICKDTKLKAIHNRNVNALQKWLVVIAICKDTKLKAIHNRKAAVLSILSLERLHFFNPLLLQRLQQILHLQKKLNQASQASPWTAYLRGVIHIFNPSTLYLKLVVL